MVYHTVPARGWDPPSWYRSLIEGRGSPGRPHPLDWAKNQSTVLLGTAQGFRPHLYIPLALLPLLAHVPRCHSSHSPTAHCFVPSSATMRILPASLPTSVSAPDNSLCGVRSLASPVRALCTTNLVPSTTSFLHRVIPQELSFPGTMSVQACG